MQSDRQLLHDVVRALNELGERVRVLEGRCHAFGFILPTFREEIIGMDPAVMDRISERLRQYSGMISPEAFPGGMYAAFQETLNTCIAGSEPTRPNFKVIDGGKLADPSKIDGE